jgi:hypothetical protein
MRGKYLSLLSPLEIAIGIVCLAGLFHISRISYPVFHTIIELLGVVIDISIFMMIWNVRKTIDSQYLLFIGIAFLFIAIFDFIHTLAYQGMYVFVGYGPNLATQLWIVARYTESLSFLFAVLFVRRKLNTGLVLVSFTICASVLLASIFYWQFFPACYIEGAGLTPFKIYSEYVISFILLCALGLFYRRRFDFEPEVFRLILVAIFLVILSELTFTLYSSVFDPFNMIGHLLKISSFYLIYKAVIVTGISKPHLILFRNLKKTEEELTAYKDHLEDLVNQRTAELKEINEALQTEIQERRNIEKELRKSSEEVMDLYNNAPCGYHSLNGDGVFILINDTELRWLGYKRDEVIGKLSFASLLTAESLKLFQRNFPVFKQRGWVKDLEFEMIRKDGTILPVLLNAVAMKDSEGNYIMSRSTLFDITERKKAEQEVRNLNEDLERKVAERTTELKATNKELQNFTYTVSHDLRAPLRAIDGFSGILIKEQADRLDPEGLRKLQIVRDNALRMNRLIDDLLSFSRLGYGAISKSMIDMDSLGNEVWNELRTINPGRNMQFRKRHLPPAYGDPALMKQVLLNLLSNAVKFSRNREPAIIESGGGIRDKETIYYVKDNGVGFDMSYYQKLFGVFQRLHSAQEFEGTGVGLAIVQRILQRHGGRIWAKGSINKGAIFYFSLPLPSKKK